MRKKGIYIVLVFTVLVLSGCSSSSQDSIETETETLDKDRAVEIAKAYNELMDIAATDKDMLSQKLSEVTLEYIAKASGSTELMSVYDNLEGAGAFRSESWHRSKHSSYYIMTHEFTYVFGMTHLSWNVVAIGSDNEVKHVVFKPYEEYLVMDHHIVASSECFYLILEGRLFESSNRNIFLHVLKVDYEDFAITPIKFILEGDETETFVDCLDDSNYSRAFFNNEAMAIIHYDKQSGKMRNVKTFTIDIEQEAIIVS